MAAKDDFGDFETAWCPGCGNFVILNAVKDALVALDRKPHNLLFVSGIGQAAKAPHYLRANVFNGLHGRALPVATGAKLANRDLDVIVQSGDGCVYSEGGNHFLAAIRRNIDVALLVHNNHVYGLTKGQVSPTSTRDDGFITRPQPEGSFVQPFNPLVTAIAGNAGFVARGFTGYPNHLSELIRKAILHKGFALVDILQPCVSFNDVSTFQWLKQRCEKIPDGHNTADRSAALELSEQWGEHIPIGTFYRNDRIPFGERFAAVSKGPLALQGTDKEALKRIIESYT
ncbi:MAG: 2-oxoacid:ferredoxin oxidoreductase subunit beta [Pseudomonadota bacterium]